MEGILMLTGLLQIIVLALYFQIAKDVRVLRAKLASQNPDVWHERYIKHHYLNNNKQALESLQEYIWLLINKKRSESNYNKLKEQWEKSFIALNASFPSYPF